MYQYVNSSPARYLASRRQAGGSHNARLMARRHTHAAGDNLAPRVLPLGVCRGTVAPKCANAGQLASQLPTAWLVSFGNFLLARRALSLVVTRRL